MELTNKIKADVMSLYRNRDRYQLRKLKFFIEEKEVAWQSLSEDNLEEIRRGKWDNSKATYKLELKSLMSMPDEHVIEFVKIITQKYVKDHEIKGSMEINRTLSDCITIRFGLFDIEIEDDGDVQMFNVTFENTERSHIYSKFLLEGYQYLILNGYDLPHYLLGGKNLKEAGLAIY